MSVCLAFQPGPVSRREADEEVTPVMDVGSLWRRVVTEEASSGHFLPLLWQSYPCTATFLYCFFCFCFGTVSFLELSVLLYGLGVLF